MSRKVLNARLHTNLFVQGAGQLGDTLPPGTKTLSKLEMELTAHEGLSVKFVAQGKPFEILIPAGNISMLNLAPEAPKEEKPKK